MYNTSGLISSPKIWVGSTTTSSGAFSITISGLSFSNVFGAHCTAILSGSNNTNAPIATLRTLTTSTVTGLVVESQTVFLGGEGLTNAGVVTVYVTVYGN